eukprot:scaffold16531_cov55-Phaeocystis_antarctica.AAC.4
MATWFTAWAELRSGWVQPTGTVSPGNTQQVGSVATISTPCSDKQYCLQDLPNSASDHRPFEGGEGGGGSGGGDEGGVARDGNGVDSTELPVPAAQAIDDPSWHIAACRAHLVSTINYANIARFNVGVVEFVSTPRKEIRGKRRHKCVVGVRQCSSRNLVLDDGVLGQSAQSIGAVPDPHAGLDYCRRVFIAARTDHPSLGALVQEGVERNASIPEPACGCRVLRWVDVLNESLRRHHIGSSRTSSVAVRNGDLVHGVGRIGQRVRTRRSSRVTTYHSRAPPPPARAVVRAVAEHTPAVGHTAATMSRTRWLRPWPAGALEAALSARSRLGRPQAPASLGQSAALKLGRAGWACFRHAPSRKAATAEQGASASWTPPEALRPFTTVRRRTCEFSRGTVGSAGTRQPAAAARRTQARGRARPAHDAGVFGGPPNNTLKTQSRAQQTHSRSRSLRAHPHSADPPSVMPRAARLGRRSWVGRHRQAERLGHLLRGRVYCTATERRCVVNAMN